MSLTNFPNGASSFGIPIYGPGAIQLFGMGRAGGIVTGKNKVIFVDSAAGGDGTGRDWENAMTTVQAGVNAARQDYGTTDINYDDDRQCFVIVAPGNYAERLAWSAKNVHLFGLGVPGGDSGVTLQPSSPSAFCTACGGPGLEVANIFFKTGSNAVYGFYGSNFENSWLHDCVLYADGVASAGLFVDGTGLKGSRVFDNYIVGFQTYGIQLSGGADSYLIHGCIERNTIDAASGTTAISVHADYVCYCFKIKDNVTGIGYTNSIVADAAQTGLMICDNHVCDAPSGGTCRNNHYTSAGG